MENMGLEGTYDKVQDNSYKEIWDVAIGLNKVDNLLPSKYLLELIKHSYNADKTIDDIEKALNKYYSTLNTDDEVIANERECDIVSTRIVKILGDKSFNFSPIYLKLLGYEVNNNLFKEYSKYFRDALVLSNYTNIKLGYKASYKYLEIFYYKLIREQEIELEIMN